jgi:hypothetical protein
VEFTQKLEMKSINLTTKLTFNNMTTLSSSAKKKEESNRLFKTVKLKLKPKRKALFKKLKQNIK